MTFKLGPSLDWPILHDHFVNTITVFTFKYIVVHTDSISICARSAYEYERVCLCVYISIYTRDRYVLYTVQCSASSYGQSV